MTDEPATPEQVAELGVDAVLDLIPIRITGAATWREAIRRAVVDGRVVAGKGAGAVPASVIQALVRRGVLLWRVRAREADPSSAELSRDLLVRCRREWDRRHAPIVDVAAALVVEYLAALDSRRGLATGANPRGGAHAARDGAHARGRGRGASARRGRGGAARGGATVTRVVLVQTDRWVDLSSTLDVYARDRCCHCYAPTRSHAKLLRTARTNDGEWWLIASDVDLTADEWKDFQGDHGERLPTLLPVGSGCLRDHPEWAFAIATLAERSL